MKATRKVLAVLLIAAVCLIVIGILIFVFMPTVTAGQRGIDFTFFARLDQWLPEKAVKQITGLLALIVVQVIIAVSLAVAQNKFEWAQLGNFYKTRVLPMLGGWIAFAILAKWGSVEIFGPTYGVLAGEGVSWAAWLAVVTSLGARLVSDCKALYGELLPFVAPAERSEK